MSYSAHDAMVLSKMEPTTPLKCPSCKENFVGETGFPVATRYMENGKLVPGTLIYCTLLCRLVSQHKGGAHALRNRK